MLRGRDEGRGGGLGSISSEREEVGGLEGAAGDWLPDLVDKSAENNSLDCKHRILRNVILDVFRMGAPESAQSSKFGPLNKNMISRIFFVISKMFLRKCQIILCPHIFFVKGKCFFENDRSSLK